MCRILNRVTTLVYEVKVLLAETGPEGKQFNLRDVLQYSVLLGLIFSVYINNLDLKNVFNYDGT